MSNLWWNPSQFSVAISRLPWDWRIFGSQWRSKCRFWPTIVTAFCHNLWRNLSNTPPHLNTRSWAWKFWWHFPSQSPSQIGFFGCNFCHIFLWPNFVHRNFPSQIIVTGKFHHKYSSTIVTDRHKCICDQWNFDGWISVTISNFLSQILDFFRHKYRQSWQLFMECKLYRGNFPVK